MADDIEGNQEKHSNGESPQLPELQRRLKSRHLQMIAMGKNSELYTFSFLFSFLLLIFLKEVPLVQVCLLVVGVQLLRQAPLAP